MNRLLLMLLLCTLSLQYCHSQFIAPANTEDPFEPPQEQKKVNFTILLGPNLQPGDVPFIDAYSLSERLRTRPQGEIKIPLEQIRVDVETPLPTSAGTSLHVRVPPSTEPDYDKQQRKKYQSLGLRYGITRVDIEQDASVKSVKIAVRVSAVASSIETMDWMKYGQAAQELSNEPTIEIFDEEPLLVSAQGIATTGMLNGGMGGGMGGMGGGGMGGWGSAGFAPADVQPDWADPTGMIEGYGVLVSWSIKDKVVAALDSQSNNDWIRTPLSGQKMTKPVVMTGMCVFISGKTAYGFSAKSASWAKHEFVSDENFIPIISFRNQAATITTDNDVLVFTQAGRWLSRNNATDLSELPNGYEGMGMEMGMGMMMEGAMGGMGMDMGGGMGMDMGMSEMQGTSPPPDIDSLRSNLSTLQSQAKELAKQFKQETDEESHNVRRAELRAITHQLIIAECDLHESELKILQRKINDLENQIILRRQRSDELIDDRTNQLLEQ